jgi:hypothetical protein
MSSVEVVSRDEDTPELIWVGDGAWVACDRRLAETDPHRVIAYLECKNQQVYVLWVRGRKDVCCYDTLAEALQVVAAASAAHALQPEART